MIKSIFFFEVLFCLILAITLQHAKAQIPKNKCGTMEYLHKQKDSDPGLEAKMLLNEKQIQQRINENYVIKSKHNQIQSVITIPVVVHILYNTDKENISDLRVFEQIAMSNRDYAGLNTHSIGAFDSSLKSNTGIQFCLAQKKPDGSPTNGIERRQTTNTSFIMDNAVKFYSKGGLDAWDTKKYFNIWVCNMPDPDGYAQYPDEGINETYGVVINYILFGSTGAFYTGNNGGTTTHEIGHCFYLNHIWGDDDGTCTGNDHCDDTPNQANYSSMYHAGVLTDACSPSSPGIMYMNFMDYSLDIVLANFTPNQTARMQAMFASPNGLLVSLANSDACSTITSTETANTLTSPRSSLFPNPVSANTTINYSIILPGNVSITITNILGIEITRISNNQFQGLGNYSIDYDASNLAPGIYFLTIKAGNNTETKKFVVLR